jgi:hypothetical protein
MPTCLTSTIEHRVNRRIFRSALYVVSLAMAAMALKTVPARAQKPEARIKVDTPVVILRSNVSSRTLTTSRIVIRDSVTWARVWDEANSARSSNVPLPRLPQVAFEREMILAAFMGYLGLGSGVSIPWVRDSAGILRIRVGIGAPGPECIGGTELQQPLVLVRVPISYSIPEFEDRVYITKCDNPFRSTTPISEKPSAKSKR